MKLSSQKMNMLETQLRQDTEELARESGRRVGQPGNLQARSYILRRMSEIGLKPFKGNCFELPYTGVIRGKSDDHEFMNLVGIVPGVNSDLPPILLGAHYDSVIDAPCADDNATSVALNMAIAERVMKSPLQRDLIIAFYDAEEPPYFLSDLMGSTRFYEDHCIDSKFAGVIVTDLIGHDFCLEDLTVVPKPIKLLTRGLEKTVFMTGAESDGVFPQLIENLAPSHPDLKIFPTLNSYIGNLSDHHAFEKAGHPFLFFSCGQGKYYHHELDTIDWINFKKLAKLTKFIGDIVYQLDITPAGHLLPQDPVDFEIRMIEKVVGAKKLKLGMKAFGLEMPKNRKDLDELIQSLIGQLM